MVFMVFSAVSIVSSFEADVGVGERNKTRTKYEEKGGGGGHL